jgi:hypothetical protein
MAAWAERNLSKIYVAKTLHHGEFSVESAANATLTCPGAARPGRLGFLTISTGLCLACKGVRLFGRNSKTLRGRDKAKLRVECCCASSTPGACPPGGSDSSGQRHRLRAAPSTHCASPCGVRLAAAPAPSPGL